MFEHPVIAIEVVAFDLMGRGGGPPQEIFGEIKSLSCHRRRSFNEEIFLKLQRKPRRANREPTSAKGPGAGLGRFAR